MPIKQKLVFKGNHSDGPWAFYARLCQFHLWYSTLGIQSEGPQDGCKKNSPLFLKGHVNECSKNTP